MSSTFLLLLVSCFPGSPVTPCHRALKDWCFHDEGMAGPNKPDPEATCPDVTFEPDQGGAFRCGDRLDVTSSSGGFTGSEMYFDAENGELVGVKFWTDVNTYCGGFEFSYGTVACGEVTCMWTRADADDAGLPLCEG